MLCPFGTASVYVRCKQLVTKIERFILSIEVYLENIWNETNLFPQNDSDTIGEEICAQFMETLALSSGCRICQKKKTDSCERKELII